MITTISQNPKYYRWVILFFCFITITFTNGLTLGGLVVFEEEIIKSLSAITGQEVLRADLKLRDALTLWSTALFGFFSGLLADESTKIKIFRLSHWIRYGTLQTITTPSVGVKKLMISGFILLSGCFYFYAQAESLFGMYILHALMGVVLCISGMIVNVILISRWFNNSRGLAIGILLAGTSVGNGLFPQINTYLLTLGDWREVMVWLSLIPLSYIPFLVFFIKDSPDNLVKEKEQKTQHPSQSNMKGGLTLIEALSTKNFWLLSLMAFCTFYSILAMIGHVFLLMREENYVPQIAATAVSIIFVGGFIGKVLSGKMAEIVGRKMVLLTGVGVMLLGSLFIVLSIFFKDPILIWIGLALYGTGWGGLYTLIQLLTADLFGIIALGKIMGVINILDTIGGGLGPYMTGVLYDMTQGYFIPFSLISCLLVIAFISASLLKIDDQAIEINR
jgi:MFS family permease